MIKHVVMFKLLNKNKGNIEKATKSLKSLKGNIQVLLSLEIGVNFTKSERSHDIVLITEFENREALNLYQSHPNHIPVVKIMQNLCSSSVVVDYEL